MISRQIVLYAIAAAAVCALAEPGSAQPYPNRPIKMILPFVPGGPTDSVARIAADRMAAVLGQPVIVENRGGAGSTVGTKAVAAAEPDGYTLLAASPSLTISPAIYKNLGYDPIKSFAPVAMIARSQLVLVANPSVPANTVQEFVAYAKANPGKINFGSPGHGTTPHMAAELFKWKAGLDIVHVPYKGAGPAVNDLLGGQLQMYFEAGPLILSLVEAGKLKALGVAGDKRNPNVPNLPTMAEVGLPGVIASFWAGVAAPAGTSSAIVEKLNGAVNESLKSPEMRATLAKIGVEPVSATPQEFAAFIAAETQRWSALVAAANIKMD